MAARARGTRHQGTPRRRQAIMAAALELFAQNGFAGTNIQDICAATGLSVGTLYHHFGSKEELLVSTYLTALNEYQAGARPFLDKQAPVAQAVKDTVTYHLSWLANHPTEARFILAFLGVDEAVEGAPAELVQENEDFLADVSDWLESAMRSGQIKRMSFRSVVALMIGPVHQWVRLWLSERDGSDIATEGRTLAEGAWAAIRHP